MIHILLMAALFVPQNAQASQPSKPETPTPVVKKDNTDANSAVLDAKLLKVTRIYVDDFGSDPAAKQIQAMLASSISASKRFIVTENKDKADAVLKGFALEKTTQEFHSLGDSAAVAQTHGAHHGEVSGSVVNGTGSISGSSTGFITGSAVAADDSTASSQAVNDARVAVRLVAADGDVIWSTTQESRGAKYKGASADIADKVVKKLIADLERLAASTPPPTPTQP
jgi:hypothetical protein